MTRFIAGFLLAILISLAGSSLSAPDCSLTILQVGACVPFLQATNGNPSTICCAGVKALSQNATTQPLRSAICVCIQQALKNVKYDANRIPLLAKDCNVDINIPPINQHTDCTKAFQ
ncbi:hypothetical protein ACFE04_026403 [Oxalis oulophora]